MDIDRLLQDMADESSSERAPARLKSRIYSALVNRLCEGGRLLSLHDTAAGGGRLCVFEKAVSVLPLVSDAASRNPCRVCHARILAERLEWAPIYWPGCPYSDFHNG
jgi:hypothetical protein